MLPFVAQIIYFFFKICITVLTLFYSRKRNCGNDQIKDKNEKTK